MHRAISLWCLGVGLLLVGCESDEPKPERVATIPVSGLVRFEGKPLAGARVVLHPIRPAEGIPRPVGVTDASGMFRLRTFVTDDGAPLGDYRVTVSCRGPYAGKEEDRDELAPELLPPKYTSPLTTEILVGIYGESVVLEPWNLRR
jgi:hypothetical protein